MKQIIQDFKTGEMKVLDLPVPTIEDGFVLVNNLYSVVSVGTERGTVSTAQKNLIGKAVARPDLVRQVVNQVQKKGLKSTLDKVKSKLDSYKPLGYSSAGIVLAVGSQVDHVKEGNLVACAGSGYASHAEIVSVPKNLVTKMPDGISSEEAAFTTVGSIALQGVRQTPVNLGDKVAVIGLGLIGLITVQLLQAAGAKVFGIDLNDFVLDKAKELGCDGLAKSSADNIVEVCRSFTADQGFDSVIITASTKSTQPVELAGEICRDRGTVVVVGAVSMDFPRQPYYDKELNIKMSRSYGPGRYDTDYEEKGKDYPFGYVRWTENRNMSAFLDLVANGHVNLKPLMTHRFKVEEAEEAYKLVTGEAGETPLGILIQYQKIDKDQIKKQTKFPEILPDEKEGPNKVGIIGAGNFAQTYLIPEIIKQNPQKVELASIVTAHGYTASKVATKYKVSHFTTDHREVINDPGVRTVFVATRHNTHAEIVNNAIKQKKHVFVEKPLALTINELKELYQIITKQSQLPVLMVGYNRRYSGLVQNLKSSLKSRTAPLIMNYRINAGYLPETHWTQDREIGGGRIIGEACHFIDLASFLIDSNPTKVYCESVSKDTLNISLRYDDDSVANISYWSNGNDKVEKEYLELFCEGQSFILDDFRKLIVYSGKKKKSISAKGGRDIGRAQIISSFFNSIETSELSIPIESLFYTSLTTFMVEESISKNNTCSIDLSLLK